MAADGRGTSSFLLSHGSVLAREVRKSPDPPFTNHLLIQTPPIPLKGHSPPPSITEKNTLLSRIIEDRRALSRSHRILMTERRGTHRRKNQSIDVSSLLPVADPRRILEETISSEGSEDCKTPKHYRGESLNDATTGMNLTLETVGGLRRTVANRTPVPTCYLNDDCGLLPDHGLRRIPVSASRPMTEMRVLRGSRLERVRPPKAKSRLVSIDMDPPLATNFHWKSLKSQKQNYVEDSSLHRKVIVTPQLRLKQKRDEQTRREHLRKSLELHRKVQSIERTARSGASRGVFDVKEIVFWTSGTRFCEHSEAGSPLLHS